MCGPGARSGLMSEVERQAGGPLPVGKSGSRRGREVHEPFSDIRTLYVICPLVRSCRHTCNRQNRVRDQRDCRDSVRPPSSSPHGELCWGLRTRSPLTWAHRVPSCPAVPRCPPCACLAQLSGSKSLAPKSQRASAAHMADARSSDRYLFGSRWLRGAVGKQCCKRAGARNGTSCRAQLCSCPVGMSPPLSAGVRTVI